ncbi:hypothetical protein GALMADRAFT_433030 [Galerina marginata CBS 339.88]|uniref:Secreted protein n=1 Tax=Galerina marginata (strain CBS 339.88) TaxID=685588 RepID=A0A067TB82_GALM3|nr:hypothetical protein GALMADRAFT_433030 [Galerina marginata CBS 339.88]
MPTGLFVLTLMSQLSLQNAMCASWFLSNLLKCCTPSLFATLLFTCVPRPSGQTVNWQPENEIESSWAHATCILPFFTHFSVPQWLDSDGTT